MTIRRVAIIGLGLIGGSIGLAVRENLPDLTTTGWDADGEVRAQAAARGAIVPRAQCVQAPSRPAGAALAHNAPAPQ